MAESPHTQLIQLVTVLQKVLARVAEPQAVLGTILQQTVDLVGAKRGVFVEVLPDRVTVLADIGERAQDIDVQRAERAKQRAEQRLAQAQPHLTAVDLDIERARIALLKSLIRLQVASRARTRV